MSRVIGTTCLLAAVLATGGVLAHDAPAEDAPAKPWSNATELGLIMTTGNTEGTNFAFGNKFKYTWSNAELTFDAAALRNESTTRILTNVGGTVVVTETEAVTASSYALAAKYRRDITSRFYWFVATSWYQNFFAGIDDRYIVAGGVGYTFIKNDKHLLKGDIGVTYTREDPLGNPPPSELETQKFAGLAGALSYEFKFSEKSKLTEDLVLFANLDTTSAWRANSITAVTASLTNSLALRVSYTILYSNEPLVTVVPPDALYEFENTDTILAAALVINF